MRPRATRHREVYIVVGDFRDRLDHALAAVRRLLRGTAIAIERVDALYRRRPDTGMLRLVLRSAGASSMAELCIWAGREDLGFVDPEALPREQRGFFFAHYLPQFKPLVRSFNLPQTALCSLGCAFIADPTPVPVLAEGTGRRAAVVLEPGVRKPRDADRDRCEMSGSIQLRALTPTS